MKTHALIVGVVALLFPASVLAGDAEKYSVAEALELPYHKAALGEAVKFFFGSQPHGKVLEDFGTVRANKRTNAHGKTDKEACQWVFLSAMLALRDKAIKAGGNAVINIRSAYKSNLLDGAESFECEAGVYLAGTTLLGTIVKMEE